MLLIEAKKYQTERIGLVYKITQIAYTNVKNRPRSLIYSLLCKIIVAPDTS
jgi:hypothetical protein